jgi:hypothetical protein
MMKTKRHTYIFYLLALAMLFSACTPAAAPATVQPQPTEVPTEAPEPTDMPTEEPSGPYTLPWLADLPPETVLLQQDYEPTFFRPEAFYPFGRFPVFTLYADGTLVYINAGETVDQQVIEQVQLAPEETLVMLENVMAMGFENLESHLDMCQEQGDDNSVCIADASFTILRAIVPSGEMREVKIYADFANDEDAYAAVTGFFTSYTHPDALPFAPTRATLFVRKLDIEIEVPVRLWPLEPELLTELVFDKTGMAVIVLEGNTLAGFLDEFPANINSYFFEIESQIYETYVVPWLPYADYSAEIESAFPASFGG